MHSAPCRRCIGSHSVGRMMICASDLAARASPALKARAKHRAEHCARYATTYRTPTTPSKLSDGALRKRSKTAGIPFHTVHIRQIKPQKALKHDVGRLYLSMTPRPSIPLVDVSVRPIAQLPWSIELAAQPAVADVAVSLAKDFSRARPNALDRSASTIGQSAALFHKVRAPYPRGAVPAVIFRLSNGALPKH